MIIANISAIEPLKGIDLIINSMSILIHDGIDVQFIHIGGLRADTVSNKEYAESLKRLAQEKGIDDRIIWLGKRNDVQDILPAFDVYVHPSRQEGLGVVLLEASIAGLPLVGSNVGGIPEVVIDGVNGFLFESNDSDQLASILEKMYHSKTLREQLGHKAQELAETNYDVNRQTKLLLSEYRLTE